jgi:hypothetical protein
MKPEFSTRNPACLQSERCPRRCSCCDRLLTGIVARLPIYRTGIFCSDCCPVCGRDQTEAKLELFQEGS